ncbi:MAG: glycosyl hydrolase family 28-related protein [Bacteroidota bacterium]
MNLNTTTISAIHASGLSVDSDIYFTTDTAEKKFWRIDNYDISSLDDGEKVLINGVGQRFKPFVQDYVNAKWFGAKGDGVTDDKVAIQAAVDFAILYHMGEILFPAGTYMVSDTIEITITSFVTDGAITIKGVGKKSTIFQGITSKTNFASKYTFFGETEPSGFHVPSLLGFNLWPIFHVKADPDLNSYVSFEHLSVRGNNIFVKKGWYTFNEEGEPKVNYYWLDNDFNCELTGIKLELTAIFYLEDVEIINCHICVHCAGALVFNMNNFVIGGAYGANSTYIGIFTEVNTFTITNSSGQPKIKNIYCNTITLTNGRITYCAHKGIDFGQGSLLTIRSVDFEQNGSAVLEDSIMVGDQETGAVFIRKDVVNEDTNFNEYNSNIKYGVALINIYDCWFEANDGYTFYTEPGQNNIINFTGCKFNVGSLYMLGVCIDLIGNGIIQGTKKVNINGCISRLSFFYIKSTYSIIIASDMTASTTASFNDLDSINKRTIGMNTTSEPY